MGISSQKASNLVLFDMTASPREINFDVVLFLDVDGVLHPEFCEPECLFCYAGALDEAIAKVDPEGRVPIVVSSAWRLDTCLDEFRALFGARTASQIIGVTPDLRSIEIPAVGWASPSPMHGLRQKEIEAWMSEFAPASAWLAIDDNAQLFRLDCCNLFVVPSMVGHQNSGAGLNSSVIRDLDAALMSALVLATACERPATQAN